MMVLGKDSSYYKMDRASFNPLTTKITDVKKCETVLTIDTSTGGIKYETAFAVNDGTNDRMVSNATDTNIAFGTKKVNVNTDGMTYNDGTNNRILVNTVDTNMISPDGTVDLSVTNSKMELKDTAYPTSGFYVENGGSKVSFADANGTRLYYDSTKTQLRFKGASYTHTIEMTDGALKFSDKCNLLTNSNGAKFGSNDTQMWASNTYMIFKAGQITPNSSGGGNLGSSIYRWGTVYATNGTINTSDRRFKKIYEI